MEIEPLLFLYGAGNGRWIQEEGEQVTSELQILQEYFFKILHNCVESWSEATYHSIFILCSEDRNFRI